MAELVQRSPALTFYAVDPLFIHFYFKDQSWILSSKRFEMLISAIRADYSWTSEQKTILYSNLCGYANTEIEMIDKSTYPSEVYPFLDNQLRIIKDNNERNTILTYINQYYIEKHNPTHEFRNQAIDLFIDECRHQKTSKFFEEAVSVLLEVPKDVFSVKQIENIKNLQPHRSALSSNDAKIGYQKLIQKIRSSN